VVIVITFIEDLQFFSIRSNCGFGVSITEPLALSAARLGGHGRNTILETWLKFTVSVPT